MASNTEWNPQTIYRELVKWLQKSSNRQLLWDTSRQEIEDHLLTAAIPTTGIAYALQQVATWYSAEGVVAGMEAKAEAQQSLYQSCYFETEAIKLLASLHAADTRRRKGSPLSFNDTSLALAKALTLGSWSEANQIGDCLLAGISVKLFNGMTVTSVAPFVLKLFTQWRNLSVEIDEAGMSSLSVYAEVLQHWQDREEQPLIQALVNACDFHIARSKDNNDEDTFEFNLEDYRLYPVEILCVLRLREQMGLQALSVPHPLMNTPLGSLYDISPVPSDALLNRFKAYVHQV